MVDNKVSTDYYALPTPARYIFYCFGFVICNNFYVITLCIMYYTYVL